MNSEAEIDYKSVASHVNAKFKNETIKDHLKMSFKNPVKITDEAVVLVNEVIQKLVIESAMRGAKQALCDHQTRIEMEQIEKILPQLLLDFP